MARRITGYILENAAGEYLSGRREWYSNRSVEAHVFKPHEYESIRRQANRWRHKPVWVYPAYFEDPVVAITGDRFKFSPILPAKKPKRPKPKIR